MIQKGWRELPSGQSLQFSLCVLATVCFPAEKVCGADWILVEAVALEATEPLTQPSSPGCRRRTWWGKLPGFIIFSGFVTLVVSVQWWELQSDVL